MPKKQTNSGIKSKISICHNLYLLYKTAYYLIFFCGTFLFWHFWFTMVVHLCKMTTSNIFKTEK